VRRIALTKGCGWRISTKRRGAFIVADAARLGTAGVVLAHNHPSGDPSPSRADCRATRALARAGETIDLAIVDHLIFAHGKDCRSMRRMGLL
jgi:DNA repair protein RadC